MFLLTVRNIRIRIYFYVAFHFVLWFLTERRDIPLLQSIQINSGDSTAFYSVCSRGCFPRVKAAVTWSWPLTSIYFWYWEWVELYLHSLVCLHNMDRGNFTQLVAVSSLVCFVLILTCSQYLILWNIVKLYIPAALNLYKQ